MPAFSNYTVCENAQNAVTEEYIYSGETTVTRYYGRNMPFVFPIMVGVEFLFVLFLACPELMEEDTGGFLTLLGLFHNFLGCVVGYDYWQRHRSRQVVLTHVQRVVPRLGDTTQSGRDEQYSLRFPVVVDGRQTEGSTEPVFHTGGGALGLRNFVGTAQNAGYDPERRCWVII